MTKIPASEVLFSGSDFDPSGRVFFWQGNVYRAIRAEKASFFRSLFETYSIQEAFSLGLIPGEITEYTLDGFDLILKHQKIPFVSYCMEWSFSMYKDAALLFLDLSVHLAKRGLMLKDGHPWNILFDGSKPFFIDWGSIQPIGQTAWLYSEFDSWFQMPLYLLSAKKSSIARAQMIAVNSLSAEDTLRLLFNRVPFWLWLNYFLRVRNTKKNKFIPTNDNFLKLRNEIEKITVFAPKTEWTNYEGWDTRFDSFVPQPAWPVKLKNIYWLLEKLRPSTLLDIGCNRGWFSGVAEAFGAAVIAADIDEPSINTLYDRVKKTKQNILPIVMDVCSPTPAHGWGPAYPAATVRFQCDMVLVLAVTHHLVFKRHLSFDTIAGMLAVFSKKWLIVEFIPAHDEHVQRWVTPQYSWYTLDNFIFALKKYFDRIEIYESSPVPRVMVFCEKKS